MDSVISTSIIIRIFKKWVIPRPADILVTLSKTLRPRTGALICKPASDPAVGGAHRHAAHRARAEWVWGQNFVCKGNEKEIVGDKAQL